MRMFVGESHSYFSPNHALWSERLNGIIFQIFDMYSTVSLYVFASVANVQRLCKWLWDISEKLSQITFTSLWKDTFKTLNSITRFKDIRPTYIYYIYIYIYTVYTVLLISWWGIKCSIYLLLSLTWSPLNLHMAWELKNDLHPFCKDTFMWPSVKGNEQNQIDIRSEKMKWPGVNRPRQTPYSTALFVDAAAILERYFWHSLFLTSQWIVWQH